MVTPSVHPIPIYLFATLPPEKAHHRGVRNYAGNIDKKLTAECVKISLVERKKGVEKKKTSPVGDKIEWKMVDISQSTVHQHKGSKVAGFHGSNGGGGLEALERKNKTPIGFGAVHSFSTTC